MEKLQSAIAKARLARSQSGAEPVRPPRAAPKAGTDRIADAWAGLREFDPDPDHLQTGRIVTIGKGTEATEFDKLRTRMLQQMQANKWTRVAITSAGPASGKSTIALNLGFSFARQPSLRTLICEMDLKRPALAKILGADRGMDFSRVLGGSDRFADHALRLRPNLAAALVGEPGEEFGRIAAGTADRGDARQDRGGIRARHDAVRHAAPSGQRRRDRVRGQGGLRADHRRGRIDHGGADRRLRAGSGRTYRGARCRSEQVPPLCSGPELQLLRIAAFSAYHSAGAHVPGQCLSLRQKRRPGTSGRLSVVLPGRSSDRDAYFLRRAITPPAARAARRRPPAAGSGTGATGKKESWTPTSSATDSAILDREQDRPLVAVLHGEAFREAATEGLVAQRPVFGQHHRVVGRRDEAHHDLVDVGATAVADGAQREGGDGEVAVRDEIELNGAVGAVRISCEMMGSPTLTVVAAEAIVPMVARAVAAAAILITLFILLTPSPYASGNPGGSTWFQYAP